MIGKYYPLPFSFREPDGDGAAYVVDADGNTVAMMLWPAHPPEETEAAEQETYAVGRIFAASAMSAGTAETPSSAAQGQRPASATAKPGRPTPLALSPMENDDGG